MTLDAPSPSPENEAGVLGWRVVSGTGEELGRVVGVVTDPASGRVKKLSFVEEDGGPPRFVPLRFVRDMSRGTVRLAGPREGYHITRVSRVMRDPEDDEA